MVVIPSGHPIVAVSPAIRSLLYPRPSDRWVIPAHPIVVDYDRMCYPIVVDYGRMCYPIIVNNAQTGHPIIVNNAQTGHPIVDQKGRNWPSDR